MSGCCPSNNGSSPEPPAGSYAVGDSERLEALRQTGLLDSPPEAAFDRVTALARRVLGVPTSTVTLVDVDRQFFKSQWGLGEPWASRRETPLSHSFCQHVVAQNAPLVVDDARAHRLVRDNLAICDLGVVSYLGVPIRSPDGYVLGALCAIGDRPRAWTDDDRAVMADLTAVVESEIALRAEMADRARAARGLSESEERFRLLADTASDVILSADASGTVWYANEALEAVFGIAPADLVGSPLARLMPARLRAAHEAGLARYVATGERRVRWDLVETTGLRADGTEFPVSISFGEYTRGGVRTFSGILRDVSLQKAAEASLVAAREAAEAATRLKSTILANMSHEIRTPLTAVLGYAELLAAEVPDELRTFAETIERAGRRLLDTLNSVLDLAQLEGGALEIDLAPLPLLAEAQAACEALRPLANQKGLTLTVDGEPVGALADRAAIGRVLDNLVGNALKFTSAGRVSVRVGPSGDGGACLRVSDTGVGISDAFLPRLFTDFQQESEGHERAYEGNGLGLAITRGLVERMGGTIRVESEQGVGSTFTVNLLWAEAPASETPETVSRAAA